MHDLCRILYKKILSSLSSKEHPKTLLDVGCCFKIDADGPYFTGIHRLLLANHILDPRSYKSHSAKRYGFVIGVISAQQTLNINVARKCCA